MHHTLSTDPNCISQRAVQSIQGGGWGGGGGAAGLELVEEATL